MGNSRNQITLPGIYSDAAGVTLTGPHGSDQLITTSTAAYLGSDEIRYPATTTITDNLSSDGGIAALVGTATLNDQSNDPVTVFPGASVLVDGSQTFSSMTIEAGGSVREIASGPEASGQQVLTVGSLSIQGPDTDGDSGGLLDLGQGSLVIATVGMTPTQVAAMLNEVGSLLLAGYDDGAWDGINPLNNSGTESSAPNPASIIGSTVSEGSGSSPNVTGVTTLSAVGIDVTTSSDSIAAGSNKNVSISGVAALANGGAVGLILFCTPNNGPIVANPTGPVPTLGNGGKVTLNGTVNIAVPAGTPKGDYVMLIAVYDGSTPLEWVTVIVKVS
jgi:hypothetical protein